MKKILGSMAVFCGIFFFAAIASASTASVLQPASDVVYDENLIVNGTGIFDSIRIGKQGVGGVTFFNGTIINETTDENGEGVPVTFGDDVRIDGVIFRTEIGGSHPLKIADSLMPNSDTAYHLGASGSRWDSLYAANGDFSGKLTVEQNVKFNSELSVADKVDLASDLAIAGNIDQDGNSYGAVKAGALVTTSAAGCGIGRSFGPYDITCVRSGAGKYRVKFNGLDVSERFFQITPYTSGSFTIAMGNVDAGLNPDKEVIRVFLKNNSNNYFDGQYFMINIY